MLADFGVFCFFPFSLFRFVLVPEVVAVLISFTGSFPLFLRSFDLEFFDDLLDAESPPASTASASALISSFL